jgi:flagellin-like protein
MYFKKRGRKTFKKRGISPLVATVLLIAFTVVLRILVILWGRNFLEERAQKTEQLAQKKVDCLNVDIDALSVSRTSKDPNSDIHLELENQGNIDIDRFIFKIKNDEIQTKEGQGLEIGSVFDYAINDDFGGAETIDIIPGIKPKGRGAPLIPCSEQHIVVQI